MKFLLTLLPVFFVSVVWGQQASKLSSQPDSTKKLILAEASCGLCKFGMNGGGCNLAVRFDGKSYYVDGAGIDDFGDAHAADGFCEAVRQAEVQGEVVNDRFQVSYFKLIEEPKKPKREKKKS